MKPWREAVKAAARALHHPQVPGCAVAGPVWAEMIFTVAKPKSAPKSRRIWPDRKPDLSKLLRSTEDALTEAGIWEDDARIVEYGRTAKVFPGEDPDALDVPGAIIRVRPMAESTVAAPAPLFTEAPPEPVSRYVQPRRKRTMILERIPDEEPAGEGFEDFVWDN